MIVSQKMPQRDMLGKIYLFQFSENLHRYYLCQTLQQFKKVDMERLPPPPCILQMRKLRFCEVKILPRVMLLVEKLGCSPQPLTSGSVTFPLNHTICSLSSGVHTPVRSQFSVCPIEPALGKQVPTCQILELSSSFPTVSCLYILWF